MLHGAQDSLNIRGAALHVLNLLGSVAAALAHHHGHSFFRRSALILRSAWASRDSAHVLMESTPPAWSDIIARDLIAHVETSRMCIIACLGAVSSRCMHSQSRVHARLAALNKAA